MFYQELIENPLKNKVSKLYVEDEIAEEEFINNNVRKEIKAFQHDITPLEKINILSSYKE
jgi:hypothetical protein